MYNVVFPTFSRGAQCVESSWNVMAYGDARKGSEGETGEWSG